MSQEAFDGGWVIVKSLLEPLGFDADLVRYGGMSPYEPTAINYKVLLEPDIARDLVDSELGYDLTPEDYFLYGDAINQMRLELDPERFGGRQRGREPLSLLQFPGLMSQRISGRHARDQMMPHDVYRRLLLDESHDDMESIISRYIDEMESRGEKVVAGGGQLVPETGNVATLDVTPGFDRHGIGRNLMGAMLQEHGNIYDNTFSSGGLQSFTGLGDKLTMGGQQTLIPFLSDYSKLSDFDKRFYGNKGIIDTVLGDVRYTQPYGFLVRNPRSFENTGYFNFEEIDDEDGFGTGQFRRRGFNPPGLYPFRFDSPVGSRPGFNPAIIGRQPLEIKYTGTDKGAITNLGVGS